MAVPGAVNNRAARGTNDLLRDGCAVVTDVTDVLIGLSTHDAAQLAAAPPDADYLCVGPVHETPTKPGRPATGVDLVRTAAERERRPWFAIGGIDRETLPAVVAAGARRIVVVRAVTDAPDPAAAARDLLAGLPAATA